MRSDFGRQDFILVRVPIERVAGALALELREMSQRQDARAEERRGLGGLVRRVVGGRAEPIIADPEQDLPPFTIHTGTDAQPEAAITTAPPPAFAPDADAFEPPEEQRVSIVAADPNWTLVELAEPVSGASLTGLALSDRLTGEDVLYFRRSGSAANEVHFDFHLYRDFEALRRVLCHSTWPKGEQEEEWWEDIAEGAITLYEQPELYADARPEDLLTDAKIAAILDRVGLSFEALFGPNARRCPMLFSRTPGGLPLR